MKKLFEIPQLKVVHFEEADIIICSACGYWYCSSYKTVDCNVVGDNCNLNTCTSNEDPDYCGYYTCSGYDTVPGLSDCSDYHCSGYAAEYSI